MKHVLCVFVLVPALLSAQDAKGPCPGSIGPDSVLHGYVMKPDRKPHRQDDGVAPDAEDAGFTLVTAANASQLGSQMGSNSNAPRTVRFVGVVDTTGKLDSTSVAITESPNPALSRAVCTALLQMRFDPAMQGGRRVAALYKDWFTFREHFDVSRIPRARP
jgi:hypothetical protein